MTQLSTLTHLFIRRLVEQKHAHGGCQADEEACEEHREVGVVHVATPANHDVHRRHRRETEASAQRAWVNDGTA